MRSLRAFGARAARTIAVAGAAIIAGATAAAAGLVVLARRQAEVIDRTGKMAARLGIATEALQAYRFAARDAGATDAVFDKGLQFLAKSLGEAAAGTGEAKMILDAWGISAQRIAAMPLDKSFELVADKIAAMTTATERAHTASKLFGRGGLELLNMLQEGTKGLEFYRETLRALGGDFSNIQARQVENAKDAVERLQTAVEIFGQRIVIKIAPAIEFVADKVLGLVKMIGGFEPVVDKLFDVVIRVVAGVARFLTVTIPNALDGVSLLINIVGRNVSRAWIAITDNVVVPVLRFFEQTLPRAMLGAAERALSVFQPVADLVERITGVNVGLDKVRSTLKGASETFELPGGGAAGSLEAASKVAADMIQQSLKQDEMLKERIVERQTRNITDEMRAFLDKITTDSEDRAKEQTEVVRAIEDGTQRVVDAIDEKVDAIAGPLSQVYFNLNRLASTL